MDAERPKYIPTQSVGTRKRLLEVSRVHFWWKAGLAFPHCRAFRVDGDSEFQKVGGEITLQCPLFNIKIKRTFDLFCRHAFDDVCVDHRCPDVAVPQKVLNGSDVITGL